MNLVSRLTAGLMLLASASSSLLAAGLAYDPEFAKSPPQVANASVELLAQPTSNGNALLRVQFAKAPGKTMLPIQGPHGPTPLRDDGIVPDQTAGDSVYTAMIQVNTQAYYAEQQRRITLAKQYSALPRFELRELKGQGLFQPSPVAVLKPRLPTVIDKFLGVPLVVDPERELLVRDVSVVEDPLRTYDPCTGVGTPMGAWTFGKLMTEIANEPVTGIHPSDFVHNWVSQFAADLTINSLPVAKRLRTQELLNGWPKLPDGRLDLAQAPFRLLAIVNRQDLRGSQAYGGSGNAGEARLAFGLLNCPLMPGLSLADEALGMTVIFEYGIPKSSCPQVRDWAKAWRALGSMVLGSPAYNAALQALTDQFTLRDANPTQLPNRSAISQVRTNEFVLSALGAPSAWQLRESRIPRKGTSAGQLLHATVAQTPDAGWDYRPQLRDYINGHAAAINAGTHVVPLQLDAEPFRGGVIDPGAGWAWYAEGIVDLGARHRFSLATCNGCHKGERVAPFLHIGIRLTGAMSALSPFLTGAGMPVSDPFSGVNRHFNDLLARRMKLDATASMICLAPADFAVSELFFEPVAPGMPH